MTRMFQILNSGQVCLGKNRWRIWMHPGRPTVIGQNLTLTLFFDERDGVFMPRFRLQKPTEWRDYNVPPNCHLNLEATSGLKVIQRAVEFSQPNHSARPLQLLIEFVAVEDKAAWAV